jgi:phenylpropionate dioxygenase-like ring-hydroxylating dioxygenase large terminal subunit
MLVKNSWYVAGWSSQISDRPVARMILNEPVALFRSPRGEAFALENRCAHRRMPLSNARMCGETLVCCYHGLTYDFAGRCVRVPGSEKVPKDLRVRSYPVVERYGALWIWMGDPAAADASRIFECPLLAPDGSNGQQFYYHVKASYLYINDNLSDLLHQAYLHNPSFGGDTEPLGEARPTIAESHGRISVKWDWPDTQAPSTHAAVGGIAGRADGWNYSTYEPPAFYINSRGWADVGTGGLDSSRAQGRGKHSYTIYQLITPETERTTHFFKIVHCEWPPDMLPNLRAFIDAVNGEDIWACEEQQKMEDLDPAAPMRSIATDVPVTMMRKMLQRLYDAEAPSVGEVRSSS